MPGQPSPQITTILNAASAGDAAAAAQLIPLVYEELRRLARQQLAREAPGQTLQPTALVHEAYLRLVADPDLKWEGRGHFFSAAAQAMRRILVDRARRRRSARHGGEHRRLPFEEARERPALPDDDEHIIALDEALAELEARDRRKSQVVMLRYFAGLTIEQTAAALDLSLTTVKDEWMFARAWLQTEISRRTAP